MAHSVPIPAPVSSFAEGELLAGRFRIVRLLARAALARAGRRAEAEKLWAQLSASDRPGYTAQLDSLRADPRFAEFARQIGLQ